MIENNEASILFLLKFPNAFVDYKKEKPGDETQTINLIFIK